jgi:hypothetical protein
MMTDQPLAAHSARHDDHEHLWRGIDSGQPIRAWAYRCDICHRTWAGYGMTDEQAQYDAATEPRLRDADEREHALDAHEFQIRAQEARQIKRKQEVENVLARAAQREKGADARDCEATRRDMAANWQAWLNGDKGRADAEARQEALDDRLHSAEDRTSSSVERSIPADDDHVGTDR